ncbi:MAG: flippase-like domain-containing protein [Chloroflexi bacterium]|nr:flippase-like domain-containing protein [Chloroflexota bacterium]
MFRKWRFWLGLVVSLAFLYLAFRQVDLASTWGAIQRANYLFLLPAVVVYFVGVWVRAVRWRYLLRPIKETSPSRLFPVVVIGYMANDILPVRMGELVRAYVLGEKERVSKTAILATIVVERVFDGLVMLAFMVTISAFIPLEPWLQQITRLAAALFLGFLAVSFVVASSRRLTVSLFGMFTRYLPGTLGQRAKGLFASFLEGFAVLQSPGGVAAVFSTSLLAWLCEGSMYYLLMFSFPFVQPFYVFLLTTAVANLGTMVPSSPGYVGTFDLPAIAVLTLFGVEKSLAASYTLVLHAALLLPVTLLGFYYLWREGITLGQVSRAR